MRPRIAVAHEWMTNWAGSEQVVGEIAGLVRPDEVVASIVSPEVAARHLPGTPVRGLWPSRLPGATEHWTRYAPAIMASWRTARIDADVLVVSAHFAAHAAAARFDGPSLVYYHTPARMLWRPEIELARLPRAARGVVGSAVLPALRAVDRRASAGADRVLANSRAVADRVRAAYGREAHVVHPPVEVEGWGTVPREPAGHLLWLGRLVAYKRPDLAVEVSRRTGIPLLVVGDGPERERLERSAPPSVRFAGRLPSSAVREAVSGASALIFPGEEDFGIAPVEVLAAGVPVVAHAAGGALDFVQHGVNGLLVAPQTVEAFAAAAREAVRIGQAGGWDTGAIRRSALPFSAQEFRTRFGEQLDSLIGTGWRQDREARTS